jgi:hypothetical protein
LIHRLRSSQICAHVVVQAESFALKESKERGL